eukprot:1139430-Pelagomonas_calceolata.AAC.6
MRARVWAAAADGKEAKAQQVKLARLVTVCHFIKYKDGKAVCGLGASLCMQMDRDFKKEHVGNLLYGLGHWKGGFRGGLWVQELPPKFRHDVRYFLSDPLAGSLDYFAATLPSPVFASHGLHMLSGHNRTYMHTSGLRSTAFELGVPKCDF